MKVLLWALPMLMLIVSIAYQNGGNVSANGQAVQLCPNNQNCQVQSGSTTQTQVTTLCTLSRFGATPCFASLIAPGTSVVCQTTDGSDCFISSVCLSNPPQNMYCFRVSNLVSRTFQTFGTTAVVGNGVSNSLSNTGTGAPNIFGFGAIGATGFIGMIAIAAGIAVLAGLNFFGSGESPESIHILFIVGMILGLWGILSIAEGFLSGSSTSFFTEINTLAANFGTGLYVLLTFSVVGGTLATVSRGGV